MLGDLHPHVMGLPFLVLAVGLALAVYHEAPPPSPAWARAAWPRIALGALLVGALGFVNSWDLPTGLALLAGAWALRLGPAIGWPAALRAAALGGAGLLALALLLYLPFYLTLRSQAQGLGVTLFRSQPHHFLLVWGPLLVPAVALLAAAWWRTRPLPSRGPGGRLGAATLGVLLGLLLFAQAWVALALIALVSLGIWLLARVREEALGIPERCALGLVVAGLALLLVPELIFLRDLFGNRMNTVFKLSYQAWALLALGGACALAVVGPALPGAARWLWRGGVVLVLGAGLVYPALAPWAKAQGFARAPTLDATAWFAQQRPAEAAALAWLRERAGPEDVVLEAPGRSYDPLTSRVGPQTGLPTVVGWPWHVTQWRGRAAPAEERERDVTTLYRTTDLAEAERLLARYRVRWVFVGANERAAYPSSGLAKFGRLLRLAYERDGVAIYERVS
jgi:YYY domain-containing protein